MPRYIKPNGTKIDINKLSETYAQSLGWKKIGESPKEKPEKEAKDAPRKGILYRLFG